jgi:hypothetical protein
MKNIVISTHFHPDKNKWTGNVFDMRGDSPVTVYEGESKRQYFKKQRDAKLYAKKVAEVNFRK